MKPTSVEYIAQMCDGKLLGNRESTIFNIKIDSRCVGIGDMFVAIIGEHKNGHDYVKDVFDAGGRIFFVSDVSCARTLVDLDYSVCVILVQNTVDAFVAIASAYLSQFNVHRIAVTGSVGKTTTKEMMACVLSSKYKTDFTQTNLNTQLGHCLTAFRADDTTEVIIFEMGMDRKGEISEYCAWIHPEIAVITNVGTAHLARLGTREMIASAKLEIAERLNENQPLIVNADSDFLSPATVRSALKNDCLLCSVGRKKGYDFEISDVLDLGGNGISFKLCERKSGTLQLFKLPILGAHNAYNASLSVAVGCFMGITMCQAAKALLQVQSTARRLDVKKINDITIIDDTYNAGPDSMKAALDTLSIFDGVRKIAIFSDILELGSLEEEAHTDVGRYAATKNVDVLIAIGQRAKHYIKGALDVCEDMHVLHYDTKDAALEDILSMLQTGDVVLIKGSNATRISELVASIHTALNGEGDSV